MKRNIIIAIASIISSIDCLGGLTFTGLSHNAVIVTPETSTGLNEIYVVENSANVTVNYTASTENVTWYKYSNLGGGYAEQITNVSKNGKTHSVALESSDLGYIIEDGTRRYYYWVVNYANHEFQLNGLSASSENECDRVTLTPDGKGDKITYYTINGQAKELSRQLTVSYQTLSYDNDAQEWSVADASAEISSFSSNFTVVAPYCDTEFTLTGDRFLRAWGNEQSATSDIYKTKAVTAETSASQTEHTADNEKKQDSSSLGGSAPAEITFKAIATDAAIFHEWQFSNSADFDDVQDRYNQNEFTYTFNDEGTTYVKYVAADDSGECYYESDVYTITIGASKLECPNAFSPANQDGVNDEWKVSYTSIVSFECSIFNRWGTKIISFSDPSQGWDGKYKGKFVQSGVYFYVIKAVGADGVKYNLSGDINIINTRAGKTSSTTTDTE